MTLAIIDCVALPVDYDEPEIEMVMVKIVLDLFDRGKNWPLNLLDLVNRLVMHDPIQLTLILVDLMVSVDRRQRLHVHRLRVRHDYDYVPLRHYERNDIGDRMDKNQRYEMFDIIQFYTLDDVVNYVIHACHVQIDIFHHIYIRQLLRMDDTIRFCIYL